MPRALINKAALRRLIREVLGRYRPSTDVTAIAADVDAVYGHVLRRAVRRDVRSHPAAFKTFRP